MGEMILTAAILIALFCALVISVLAQAWVWTAIFALALALSIIAMFR